MQPVELLLVLMVVVGIPVTVGLGLYWLVRKAVADGNRDALAHLDS